MYVPGGSIVPMGPAVQYALERSSDTLEVRIYPGDDATFELYDDEGDGYAYEHGSYATIPLRWDDHNRKLTIGRRHGSYPGMPVRRVFSVVLVRPGHGIGDSQDPNPDRVVSYSGAGVRLSLP
jgi:alpha-D-xyloside xylohydrolase